MRGRGHSSRKRWRTLVGSTFSLTMMGCAASHGALFEQGAAEAVEDGTPDASLTQRQRGTFTERSNDGTDDAIHKGDVDSRVAVEEPAGVQPPQAQISQEDGALVNRTEAPDTAKTSESLEAKPPEEATEAAKTSESLEAEPPAIHEDTVKPQAPAYCPELPGFFALGAGTHAAAATPDGRVIVGKANDYAFRWSTLEGMQWLPGGESAASGVSANGKWITGAASGGIAVWNDTVLSTPVLPDSPSLPFRMITSSLVLNDGTLFGVCLTQYRPINTFACRWNGSHVETVAAARVYAADASGAFAGFYQPDPRADNQNRSAVLNGVSLGIPPGCARDSRCRAELRAFNPDHSVAVGTALLPHFGSGPPSMNAPMFEMAIVYTPATRVLRLDDLPGGDEAAGAYTVSADGRIIAGFATDGIGRRAALWIDKQPRALADVLSELAIEVPAGWVLSAVRAISDNGRVLIGNGIDADGSEQAFRIELPSAL